jgi:hypothetical protein
MEAELWEFRTNLPSVIALAVKASAVSDCIGWIVGVR